MTGADKNHQTEFLRFAIEAGVLKFGEFELKSGRISPYFFNAGLFDDGALLAGLGSYYAQAIVASGIEFDMLFGPAYKGIPLVSATAVALHNEYAINKPWAFNRKEAKDHGEGGWLVGSDLAGRVLVIDDVISAGTAIRESLSLIDLAGAELAAVCVSLDRQERGSGELSAIQELEQEHGVQVVAISNLAALVKLLGQDSSHAAHLAAVLDYLKKYGV